MPDDVRVFILADDDRAVRNLIRRFDNLSDLKVMGSAVVGTPLDPGPANVLLVQTTDPASLSATVRSNLPALWLVPRSNVGDVTAEAVLPFEADTAQIWAALMAVAAGLRIQPSTPDGHALDGDDLTLLDPLTEREISVLNLMAEGLSNPEIAKSLGISRNTAKFHVSSVISKLGVVSRTEAVAVGLKRGLIIV